MNWNWILGPLLGLLIGAVTNGIAIKMLFWPPHPVYWGRFHLPLTPGLIPKERERLAKAVGDVVSGQLLSSQVVTRALSSPEMADKVAGLADVFFSRYGESEKTLRQELGAVLGQERVQSAANGCAQELKQALRQQLEHFDQGEQIVQEALRRHYEENPPGALMRWVLDSRLRDSVAASVGAGLDHLISSNAAHAVDALVDRQLELLLETETGNFLSRWQERLPQLRQMLKESYLHLLEQELPRILAAADLSHIVEERILSYDVTELEGMVRGVARRELNAIVWFGAALGFVLGFLTALF